MSENIEGAASGADAPKRVTITWKPAGPMVIEGDVTILDNAGEPCEPPPTKVPGQIKLCGCGHTATKPFCDGNHKR